MVAVMDKVRRESSSAPLSVSERRKSLARWCRETANPRRKAAMAEYAGATGGYLVPPELYVGIDEKLKERKLFHKRAYHQPMGSHECWIPAFDLSASHATGASPLFAGLAPGWTTVEGQALDQSNPAFAGGKLVTRDLECYAAASNQLLDDGGEEALGAYLEEKFYQALAWGVERACFIGDGATMPAGVASSPATKVVTRAGSGTIAQADVANMVGALLPACFKNAVWGCSVSALAKVAALAFYSANNVRDEETDLCGLLFARPLYVTENLPAVGTQGDLVLFDPTQYVLGERHVEVTASRHPNFLANQTVFRLWWRGDGRLLPNGLATLADGTTTTGVAVALSTL